MQSEQVDSMVRSGLYHRRRPALEVMQTNKTQIGLNKQITHKLKSLKTHTTQTNICQAEHNQN